MGEMPKASIVELDAVDILALAHAIASGAYPVTPSLRILARDYIRLREIHGGQDEKALYHEWHVTQATD
jgi:hypothetical protein